MIKTFYELYKYDSSEKVKMLYVMLEDYIKDALKYHKINDIEKVDKIHSKFNAIDNRFTYLISRDDIDKEIAVFLLQDK